MTKDDFTVALGKLKNLGDNIYAYENRIGEINVRISQGEAERDELKQLYISWLEEIVNISAQINDYLESLTKPNTTPLIVNTTSPVANTNSPVATALSKFAPVSLYNYNDVWHPLTGPQPGKQPDGWSFKFENNVVNEQGELLHKLTNFGAAGIKWEAEKKKRKTQGHYLVEATLPQLNKGLICAPLWLYSEGASEGGHEYDFELMQGRIEYNLHNGRGGFKMKSTAKDLSFHRCRFEIIRRPGKVIMRVTSLTDGFTDELVITPSDVQSWSTTAGAPPGLVFPPDNIAMFPMTEHWVSRWSAWSGTYETQPEGASKDMIIHGFRFLD